MTNTGKSRKPGDLAAIYAAEDRERAKLEEGVARLRKIVEDNPRATVEEGIAALLGMSVPRRTRREI